MFFSFSLCLNNRTRENMYLKTCILGYILKVRGLARCDSTYITGIIIIICYILYRNSNLKKFFIWVTAVSWFLLLGLEQPQTVVLFELTSTHSLFCCFLYTLFRYIRCLSSLCLCSNFDFSKNSILFLFYILFFFI